MRAALTVSLAAIVLAGCGSQASVPRSSLEKEIATELAAKAHAAPPAISCPRNLPGKTGAGEQCVLQSGSTRLPVGVLVDRVDGSHVHFRIEVGRVPLP
ncbi:MAG: hypothetical protein NVSMB51_21450 [Solirubrobacteraceae bacterium]